VRGVGAGLPGLGWERRAVPDLARVDAAADQVAGAASMPATISPPSAEPGAAVVSPVPNVTEAAEPGG
jgi:hypothetical protein